MGTCKNMVIRTSSQREKRRVHAINCALVNYKKFQNTVSAVEISRNCSLFFFPLLCQILNVCKLLVIITWFAHGQATYTKSIACLDMILFVLLSQVSEYLTENQKRFPGLH